MTQPSPDELASIAIQLVSRVRDDEAEANGEWLREVLPDPEDRFRLCFVLAAAIPDDRPWLALTAWSVPREHPAAFDPEAFDEGPVLRPAPSAVPKAQRELKPCGTPAAARRHQYHGEDLDEECRTAERTRDRERKQIERSAA